MVPPVAGACVIGVDVGGTKLLAGAVDADLAVHHRAQRSSQDLRTAELLDVLAEMVARGRPTRRPRRCSASGFGIPGASTAARGVVAACPHLPLEGVPFQALMEERLGHAGRRSTTTATARCSPSGATARRVAATTP